LKKKAKGLTSILIVALFITIMVSTTPTESQFENWFIDNYNMICDENGYCQYEEKQLLYKSSHKRNAAIFVSYEKVYEDKNGEPYTFRALGILGNIIAVKEGMLWDLLN